jgi:glycosyltransferase A (GT-A) superfamily protein (DUF2064 family)
LRAVGVFVTAPIPGRVNPRLAAAVGPSTAAEVYWRVGGRVVEAVAGPGYRTVVYFAPPGEGAFVREWLNGVGRVEFRPLSGRAPVTERLRTAFGHLFAEGGRRVVLVGTACPGMDRRLVAEAFTALGERDMVLGPTAQGGLYLIGLRVPRLDVFAGLPWRGGAAAAQARARGAALGLSIHRLRPLRAVGTFQDARVLGLLKS